MRQPFGLGGSPGGIHDHQSIPVKSRRFSKREIRRRQRIDVDYVLGTGRASGFVRNRASVTQVPRMYSDEPFLARSAGNKQPRSAARQNVLDITQAEIGIDRNRGSPRVDAGKVHTPQVHNSWAASWRPGRRGGRRACPVQPPENTQAEWNSAVTELPVANGIHEKGACCVILEQNSVLLRGPSSCRHGPGLGGQELDLGDCRPPRHLAPIGVMGIHAGALSGPEAPARAAENTPGS